MDAKMWAIYFVAMLSFDYASAHFFGDYKGVPKPYDEDGSGYYGWSSGCHCNEDLTSLLDEVLGNVQGHLSKYKKGIPCKDYGLEEYEFRGGHVGGFHKFKRIGPYRCSVSRDFVRIYFRIGFVRILVNYTVSLVEDLLHGLLGGIGSLIGHILGAVTDLLFCIILPDVSVTVVLTQRLDTDAGLELEGLHLNRIGEISFKDRRYQRQGESFKSQFRPVCDHVLRGVFQEKLGGIFTTHFKKVTVEKEMFSYKAYEETETDEEE